jgi:hypothetical protein
MSRNLGSVVWVMALVLGLASMATASPVGSIYNPNDYTLLGTLDLSDSETFGTLIFNTDTGNVSFVGTLGGTDSFTNHGGGSLGQANQSGNVQMAVFTYNSISLGTGVRISVIGNQGIVLASQGDFTFEGRTTLNVSGWSGFGSTGGTGGSGAEGGGITSDGNIVTRRPRQNWLFMRRADRVRGRCWAEPGVNSARRSVPEV